jgi:hypothetical protein
MNKKHILVVTFLVAAITSLASIGYANNSHTVYNTVKSNQTDNQQKHINPDGSTAVQTQIKYPENKSNDLTKFKKETDINGYVSDEALAAKGAKYTRKQIMTYEAYVNLNIDGAVRYDIDPDRMVWVFTSKFDKTHYINDKPVEKAVITTVYDAESGEMLSINVNSDDPHGMDAFNKNNK